MGLRDIYQQNIRNKQTFQEQMRGRSPISAPETPITQGQAPQGVTLPGAGETIGTGETPIDATAGGIVGADAGVGVTLDPGDQPAGDTSGDIMGTAGKMSQSGLGGMTGMLNLAKGAYRSGKNLMTGNLSMGDAGTGLSLGKAVTNVAGARGAGATTNQILEGMARVNPMQSAASMMTTGILSELGFDRSGMSRFGRNVGGLVGSAFGPLGSVVGQLGGGTLGTAASDLTGSRRDDEALDYYEGQRGAGGWKGWLNPAGYVAAQRDRAHYLQQQTDIPRMRSRRDLYRQQMGDRLGGLDDFDTGLDIGGATGADIGSQAGDIGVGAIGGGGIGLDAGDAGTGDVGAIGGGEAGVSGEEDLGLGVGAGGVGGVQYNY